MSIRRNQIDEKIIFDTPIGGKYWLVTEKIESLDLFENRLMLNFGNVVIEVKDIDELFDKLDDLKRQIDLERNEASERD